MIVEIINHDGYEFHCKPLADYYKVGSQHRAIEFFPDTGEVELVGPEGGDTPGEGVTFFPGEYKIVLDE